MKKIFTLLALCLSALTSFAQDAITSLEDGSQYYITVGSKKVGFVTAGDEDGGLCTAKGATAELIQKQTWTAHQVTEAENTWTFTAEVDGATWYLYTEGDRLHAGTTAGDNFQNYVVTFNPDDPTVTYASMQMLETVPDNGQAYVNIYGGQSLNNQYGPWTDASSDPGSQVFFIDPTTVEIPTWDFAFTNYEKGNNDSRYFIQFNRDRTTNPSADGGPKGIGGLTENFLVLSVNNDTLVADSVIIGDTDFTHKIWHIDMFNSDTHEILLQNEAGQYITFKQLDEAVPGGNTMFSYDEATGTYVRTGNSGGGDLTEAWMATTNKDDAGKLYVFASNQGSECYAIGDSEESTEKTFINAWGNVGWHHFMGKWSVNDPNCALKFVPITNYLSGDQIPEDSTLTGISTISTAKKAVDGTVYTIDGRVAGKSLNGLAKGLYIVGGKKVIK